MIKDLWAEITIFANPYWEKAKYSKFLWNRFNIVGIPTFTTMWKLRNDILSYYNEGERILMLDDDISKIYKLCFKNGKAGRETISTQEFLEVIECWFGMCESAWYKLRWIYPSANPLCMKDVVSYNKLIIGTVMGIIKSKISFDENVNCKEDYDFTIQNVLTFWWTIRFDYLCHDNKYAKTKWWLQDAPRSQQKDIAILEKKWWNIIKRNPKKIDEIFIKF